MEPLTLTGLGASTSVGRGVVTSCASIRAGITRPQPLSHFQTIDIEDHEAKPLTGHPIAGLTDGFGPSARWSIMARHALTDLISSSPRLAQADAAFWSRCGVAYVLPVLEDARFYSVPPARPDAIWGSCLDPIAAEHGLTTDRAHRHLSAIGPGGLAQAILVASSWLGRGTVDRALVVAVDSLLDAWSLGWLASGRRLKDDSNPVGVAPGEAAVALLLEAPAALGAAKPLARIVASVFKEDDQPFQNPERRQGRAAFTALDSALRTAGPRLEGDLYVNLNGEDWRAAEVGAVLAALPAASLGAHNVRVPATCVGDIGAAAGALHIACAQRAFARGYSTSSKAWILATSDYGDVSAVCLEISSNG